uniref:Glycoside hydrolase family 3 N-terminal domain-containing protein n=1 Tax=Fagus sylvatica TaxID=28930 RepID=A0A2N9ICF2_FAGSY
MAKISLPLVGLVFLCVLAVMVEAEGEYMKYKDPKQHTNARIRDLMKRMTLEEKIGQMVQADFSVVSREIMRNYSIGSVLSGGGSTPRPNATPLDWINMINDFQNGSLDADLVKRIGAATALEVKATGISYAFGPCVAVCRDPRWGRCYESYSEDHEIVNKMTDIIIGLQGEIPADSPKGVPYVGKDKVLACAKHYVGDGGTTRGINENNTVIDRHGLLSIHMPPYSHSIIKGVGSIMTSYSSWNGVKMHANRDLVTNFLKGTLKFRGFVISDWQGIDKITYPIHSNYSYSVLAGIRAGIDMVMVPYNFTEFIDDLTNHVNNKLIPMSRIDDAVRRILRVKFTMGMFENPLADESFVAHLGSQAHRDLAREAVRKSLVLLKNGENADSPVLPLPKNASRILVAGSHANNLGYQCGGWTIAWQGLSGNNITAGIYMLN